ncbi:ABC transporter substrate-binding protein [Bradyrhizobium diversitatis]|uniref:ABC transporter substrate-binding protein n=1 Tax=Bradyrhizobium diversitatis TaxID=2755406 RepID=A0ABS0P093_9BRAD|nr:ABC transporter substrate-binding protein [Bradyrhizobium diversitatis]MBH5386649.1 ABC transporter substrate-binding protein [Bradyrhizobium diversitatis]
MFSRSSIAMSWLSALAMALPGVCFAQDTLRIGLIVPMTGPFASTGRMIETGVNLYIKKHGNTVAGRRVEIVLKDDTGTPDIAKRLAQELVTNDKVNLLAGFGLTPVALSVAPLATQAKVPMVVMMAATSTITEASPYIVRTSYTLPQVTEPLADWARKNSIAKVVTLVSDYGPGIDAERAFRERFSSKGGAVAGALRVPLRDPDFSPALQRAADAKADALFVFVPTGAGTSIMKQIIERGLDKSGLKVITAGSIVEDEVLNTLGDAAVGLASTQHYSAAHDSPENREFVADYKAATNGGRPDLPAVHAYDGMHLIYEAVRKTAGSVDGQRLVDAMKGLAWMSPRGPVSIDPDTRDIIQNVYVRKVMRRYGELYNVELETIPDVKDPVKLAKKKSP